MTRRMSTKPLKKKRIMVTGGEGFLGNYICKMLKDKYEAVPIPVSHKKVDLRYYNDVKWEAFYRNRPIHGVIHCAGYNGGIEFNRQYPADIFYNNTIMGLNVLEQARRNAVEKVVSIVASCAYGQSEDTGGVMFEHRFLQGEPHESVACHGYAKRNLQLASKFYNEQYDLRAVTTCVTTLYGPGDSFHPVRTKVVGALIKKIVDAVIYERESVSIWGTGRPLREFMFVEDAADAVIQAYINYENCKQPLNIGTTDECSIKELAKTIAKIVNFKGEIHFGIEKEDGQYRKALNKWSMPKFVNIELTSLERGLRETIKWYLENERGKEYNGTGIFNGPPGSKPAFLQDD